MENKNYSKIEIFNKIALLSFMLSVLVVLIHNYSLEHFNIASGTGYSIVSGFIFVIKECLTNFAVPFFFVISAALFYRNYSLQETTKKYKSRFKSLVIPYLLWNTIWLIFNMIISVIPFISSKIATRELFTFNITNILEGIFLFKYNGPFWYVCALIIFTVLCPLIYFMVKDPKIGLLSIILFICLYLCGLKLPFIRSDIIIFYLIGAYLGIHAKTWLQKKNGKKPAIIALVVFVLLIPISYCFVKFTSNVLQMFCLLITQSLQCFTLWIALDLLKHENLPSILKTSFFIYAFHYNIESIIVILFSIILPHNSFTLFISFTFGAAITISLCLLVAWIMKKWMKPVWNVLTGSR